MKLKIGRNLLKSVLGILFAAAVVLCAIKNGSSARAAAVLSCALILSGLLQVEIGQPKLRWLYGIAFLTVPAATFYIGQILQNISLFSVPPVCVLLNIAIMLILQLIVLMITNNLRLSMTVGCAVPALLVLINTYVYMFRGNALTPADVLSVRTAAAVAGDYAFLPTANMLYGLAMAAILILAVWCLPKMQTKRRFLIRAVAASVCSFTLLYGSSRLVVHNWENDGALFNGYLLNFLLQTKAVFVTKPEGYGPDAIEKLEEACSPQKEITGSAPDIIVIMDESFADLRMFGNGLSTSREVMPFIDSLQDNTIRGYMYASVFGGGTANSEYEFLSGNSMAFFPQGSAVYQQYIREEPYSLLSALKQSGYDCVAMHPFHETGWKRNTVYPCLGFDEMYFLGDFPQDKLVREFVGDQSMFEYITDYHEQHDKDVPLFLFGITMQNHGGYAYEGPNYEQHIALEGYSGEYPWTEQYLSLIHETDEAVRYLIEYYTASEREVLIVFCGDHMPKIEDAFYETLNGGSFDTLEEQMRKQLVPFFIWANYDLEERNIPCSSINYLPVYVLEAAGIPMPPYFQFLKQTEQVIPAINAFGYYSREKEDFLPFAEASGAEAEAIRAYAILQYNNVFDDENRSTVFFEP